MSFECKKTLECVRCGDCCHIRQSKLVKLTDKEDYKVRKKVYETAGIIYIFPLKHYTISLTKEEKLTLESEAKKLSIKIKIKPKKMTINKGETKAEVLDYFLDHDICPFLKDKNICLIYESRPQVCRIFPRNQEQKLLKLNAKTQGNFEHILKKAKKLAKSNI